MNKNDNKKYHYIYKITNLLNSKYYIGMHSTNNLEDGYLGSGTYLRRSVKKHGKDNFRIEILHWRENREELSKLEKEIVTLDEIAKVECMNLKIGGGSESFHVSTKETKQKQSISQLQRYKNLTSEEIKQYKIMYKLIGVKTKASRLKNGTNRLTKEQILKMVSTRKANGYKHSEETKNKMRGKRGSNPLKLHLKKGELSHMFGKKLSKEHKEKIGRGNKGKEVSFETREKIRNAQRGISKTYCMKPIIQLDLTGKEMKEWPSMTEASKILGVSYSGINACCNLYKKRESAGNYKWKFKEK